ncbi:MAG: S8 family serine peptidase [Verrucomicrobiia bacterium]
MNSRVILFSVLACWQTMLFAQPLAGRAHAVGGTTTVYLVLEGEPAAAVAPDGRSRAALSGVASRTRARAVQIQSQHTALQAPLQTVGAEVTGRFVRVANALRVRVPRHRLAELAALPGVERIEMTPLYERQLSTSVPFIGAPAVWSSALGADGRGVRIGIIDSGIDYTHADFGGSGKPEDYSDNDSTRIEPGTFPTPKVVGGFDFAGDEYNPGDADRQTPKADPDPLDCRSGHGTHVAGIAAGLGVLANGQTYTGNYSLETDLSGFRIGPGVAPRALLYALKVFGCEGATGLVTDALEWAADPNGDFDFSDRLDIVNLSLGGTFGTLDPDATDVAAANRLAALGCVVVCAAGNDGNTFFAVSAPSVAERAISVANSIDKGQGQAIEVLEPASIAGKYYLVEGAITKPLTNSGVVTGKLVYIQPNLACEPPQNSEALKGNIALIDRGTCFFTDKILNAQAAGAIAVVMVNNQEAAPIPMGGETQGINIPGGMISMADGERIKARLDETVTVRLDADAKVERPEFVDTLDDGSSRGPAAPRSTLKPELSAPGIDVLSAKAASGAEGVAFSGTSMSAPVVAGAAALLRQLHPDWDGEQIKAALMNTAKPLANSEGTPYPESRGGAGRVQAAAAARTLVTASAAGTDGQVGLSFGSLVLSAPHQETRNIRITNHGQEAAMFDLTVTQSVAQAGVRIEVLTNAVTVPAHGSAEVPVELRADPAAFDLQPDATTEAAMGAGTPLPRHFLYEASGQVWMTASNASLHLPFYANLRAASDYHRGSPTITLPASDSILANPEITVRFQGSSVSSNLWPLVSAFELGATSPNKLLNDPNRAAADLIAVGTASDINRVQSFAESSVYFGLATAAAWATPQPAVAEFDIFIDLNNDGLGDYAILNDNASATNSGGGLDVFMSVVLELGPDSEILGTNSVRSLNVYPADMLDTAPFNSSVMILPAPATAIGLTRTDASFRYKVFSFVPSGSFDQTGWISYDAARPVIDTTAFSFDGSPIYDDGIPLRVRLDREAAAQSGQRLPRLLLLHHLGMPQRQMELITFDLSNDDTDNDTLPDWWEHSTFASIDIAGRETDTDGDGVTDRQEFSTGTDPTDSISVFKMISATRVSQRNIAVRWYGVAGQVYALERSTNLLSGFTETVRQDVRSTPPINSVTDTRASGPGPFFYRVRLQE